MTETNRIPIFRIDYEDNSSKVTKPDQRNPCPFDTGYIQADSRARFFHCSTFTPLIQSHKGKTNSQKPVNALIVTWECATSERVRHQVG